MLREGWAAWGEPGAVARPALPPPCWLGGSGRGVTAAGSASEASAPGLLSGPVRFSAFPGPRFQVGGAAAAPLPTATNLGRVPAWPLVLFFIQRSSINRHCAAHLARFLFSVKSVKDARWASCLMGVTRIPFSRRCNSEFLHQRAFPQFLKDREPSLSTHVFTQRIFIRRLLFPRSNA